MDVLMKVLAAVNFAWAIVAAVNERESDALGFDIGFIILYTLSLGTVHGEIMNCDSNKSHYWTCYCFSVSHLLLDCGQELPLQTEDNASKNWTQ